MSRTDDRTATVTHQAWARAAQHPVALDALWVVPSALGCAVASLAGPLSSTLFLVGTRAVDSGTLLAVVSLVQVGALLVRRVRPVAIVVVAGLAQWAIIAAGTTARPSPSSRATSRCWSRSPRSPLTARGGRAGPRWAAAPRGPSSSPS